MQVSEDVSEWGKRSASNNACRNKIAPLTTWSPCSRRFVYLQWRGRDNKTGGNYCSKLEQCKDTSTPFFPHIFISFHHVCSMGPYQNAFQTCFFCNSIEKEKGIPHVGNQKRTRIIIAMFSRFCSSWSFTMAFPTLYPSSISGQFLDSSGRFRKIAHFENNVFLHAYCQNGAVSVVKNSLKTNLKNNTRLDSMERVAIYA